MFKVTFLLLFSLLLVEASTIEERESYLAFKELELEVDSLKLAVENGDTEKELELQLLK